MSPLPELLSKATMVGTAALLAQVGDDVGGLLGEIAKFGGLGGVSVTAVVILNRAWKQRSEVQSDTITELREENARLRELLSQRDD